MRSTADSRCRIVIGRKYANLLRDPLEAFSSEIIEMPDNPLVDSRLSGHIDLAMFQSGPSEVLIPVNLKDSDIEKTLNKAGIRILYTTKQQGREYPEDSVVNACVCGDYLLLNPKTADESITAIYSEKKKDFCKTGIHRLLSVHSGRRIHHNR